MDAVIQQVTRPIRGTVSLPADKAVCHRAALVGALAKGVTRIRPWSPAEDCQATLRVLESLGVTVVRTEAEVQIQGVGLTGLHPPQGDLDCGESGTTMRLMAGVLAGQPFRSRLTAGPSLSRRPMCRIAEPLRAMGACVEGVPQPSSEELSPPLLITGRRSLQGLTYRVPVASAQVKSAILLAGVSAASPVTVMEPQPTRDHTERMLQAVGLSLITAEGAITLHPPRQSWDAPGLLTIPGDVSSAAFFIVASTIIPGSHLVLRDVGCNPSRTAFLDILRRMGASIDVALQETRWEPRGTITVNAAPLRGTSIDPAEAASVIDELPILMVAACAAQGQTCFGGLGELKVKETDRLQAMATNLSRLGASVRLEGEAGLRIIGSPLRGAEVESFGDHRTAMSMAVAGLMARGSTCVRGAGCVAKSFGTFFDLLASVAGTDVVTTRSS